MRRLYVLGLLLVLLLAIVGCGSRQAPPPQPQLLPIEQQKQVVLDFEKRLGDIDQKLSKEAFPTFVRMVDQHLQKGVPDAISLYDAADKMQQACRALQAALSVVVVPNGLPPEVTAALSTARDKLIEAW